MSALTAVLVACSGGQPNAENGIGAVPGAAPCDGFCQTTTFSSLSVADVQTVIAQAVAEAKAQSSPAVISVVDRVGNVLAVYAMTGAPATVRVGVPEPIDGGLEGISLIPAGASAIAKAITGAYLSSEGNAFTTRTASQIVQANFNPGEVNQPAGPLFGVQFSQLPCSDLSTRLEGGAGPGPGPHRSPLGLSADPGGLPLYKNGTVVGGIGIESDGLYTADQSILDRDADVDELIAVGASFGFAAPRDRRADRITADGKTLRFADVDFDDLAATPGAASFAALTPADGTLAAVPGYTEAAAIVAGTAFGQPASGYMAATDADFVARDAFLLVDRTGANRYAPRNGAAGSLTAAEARQLLLSALDVANSARAQIRRPVSSPARVTISVVDAQGDILGIARTRDAPVFGTEVSLQKARSAALMSSAQAAAILQALPPAGYLQPDNPAPAELRRVNIGDYVSDVRAFLGSPTALGDGAVAFADRSIGNLARPFYPDGIASGPPGPLSKPPGEWSPFSDGIQLDIVYNALVRHVAFVLGAAPDVPQNCSGIEPLNDGLGVSNAASLLRNGIQIFPGSVPVYRGNQLVGAVGVSGDGIDQDDMISFLGTHNAGIALGGAIGNAPKAIRADTLQVDGVNLRYIQCPQSPFLDSNEQNACEGK